MILESQAQQLYDLVHSQYQHFSIEDAKRLHDILSQSKGRISAKVMEHRFKISSILVMNLKKKYK